MCIRNLKWYNTFMANENDTKWSFWKGVFPWILWALTFFALEFKGLKEKQDEFPPLTYVLTRWVPGWLLFMGIGWLIWHFMASYLS